MGWGCGGENEPEVLRTGRVPEGRGASDRWDLQPGGGQSPVLSAFSHSVATVTLESNTPLTDITSL